MTFVNALKEHLINVLEHGSRKNHRYNTKTVMYSRIPATTVLCIAKQMNNVDFSLMLVNC